MGVLSHRHWWRSKTQPNSIMDGDGQGRVGTLLIEDCCCGAVRQIEFGPGRDPIIRIVYPPQKVSS